MNKILCFALLSASLAGTAQTSRLWQKKDFSGKKTLIEGNKLQIQNPKVYTLNFEALKSMLQGASERSKSAKSKVIINFPNSEGEMEDFRIYEKSNFEPSLQAKYSDIRSYVGESVFGKSRIYFSVSPVGLSTMELKPDSTVDIIEPYTTDLSSYVVFKRTDDRGIAKEFECKLPEIAKNNDGGASDKSADDGLLRTYRLALSCTGEYGAWAGSVSNALAKMNATMTRVNGVFENEFSIHMNLIAEEENIIFLDATTDPYSDADAGANGAWNGELKKVLMGTTYGIGDSKYDIGHLFGRSGGGGNAGCIGCVCNSSNTYVSSGNYYMHKGQGFTSPGTGDPTGDDFDIDYVAHEMGHQFGGYHTFTFSAQRNPSQMEPGSGSSIMGYAGITPSDVQAHSDAYFHAASIKDITNYMKSTAANCSVNTPNANKAPVADAGRDYVIPKNTPFVLSGAGSDDDDANLTYCWEQFDLQNTSGALPSASKTSGVNFRSFTPTASPLRYFPTMKSILAGQSFTKGVVTTNTITPINTEYLPNVARSLNFRLTVRDNRIGGGANAYDDMKVTVSAVSGPFKVLSPDTAVTYTGLSSQVITWDVASTTAAPVSCANVDIFISTDEGATWSSLVLGTPNDGSETVVIPNVDTTKARIMVKASDNIFFDVSDANFTINKNLGVSDISKTTAQIYPNPVKDVLNVSNIAASSSFEILNTAGQIVAKGILSDGKTSVARLSKGVYILNLNNNGTAVRTKFVKE